MLLEYIGNVGWSASAFNEDMLASKKLYPGHSFYSKGKKWAARLRVTPDVFALLLRRLSHVQINTPKALYRKPNRAQAEALCERACVVVALRKEIKTIVPIRDELLEQEWTNPWATGDEIVDTHIQTALMDKDEGFEIKRDIAVLATLIDRHLFEAPVKPVVAPLEKKMEIDADEFELFVKQANYDITVFDTWQEKQKQVNSSNHESRMAWRVAQDDRATKAAMVWLASCFRAAVWQSTCEAVTG